MSIFCLPDVGEGLQEAEVVAWHVAIGDRVVADQPLVSVETDKAVVEIPSPTSGLVAALHAEPGDVVQVGDPLVEVTDGRAADRGAIVGDLPAADSTSSPEPAAPPIARGIARATPAVRAYARSLRVELAGVAGSGPGGTITRADVDAVASGPVQNDGATVPLRGVRRRDGRQHEPSPCRGRTGDGHRRSRHSRLGAGVGHDRGLVRAIARACEREPALNAAYLGRDRGRRLHDHVDVGVAVDTEDGLFVPVLRDVVRREPDDLRRGIQSMRTDVEARTVAPEHLRDATISLSNFGVFGGLHAALVVVPPQVAIIGAGRARDVVAVRDGEIVVRRYLPLSLTFDHRVVMGGEAARFLAALKGDLEDPT